jgi:hypothetical protein
MSRVWGRARAVFTSAATALSPVHFPRAHEQAEKDLDRLGNLGQQQL